MKKEEIKEEVKEEEIKEEEEKEEIKKEEEEVLTKNLVDHYGEPYTWGTMMNRLKERVQEGSRVKILRTERSPSGFPDKDILLYVEINQHGGALKIDIEANIVVHVSCTGMVSCEPWYLTGDNVAKIKIEKEGERESKCFILAPDQMQDIWDLICRYKIETWLSDIIL